MYIYKYTCTCKIYLYIYIKLVDAQYTCNVCIYKHMSVTFCFVRILLYIHALKGIHIQLCILYI